MITIKNTQRKISINNTKITKIVQNILDYLHYSDFDIGIWFTTNHTIRKYNKTYRKKDKSTDILSFPFHISIDPEKKIIPKTADEQNLGDIIISLEYAQTAAKKAGISLEQQLKILLVHGICHLIGYTHETDTDYEKMHKKELELLKQI